MEDNIKMDLDVIGWGGESEDGIHPAEKGASGELLRHDSEVTDPRSVVNFMSNIGIRESKKILFRGLGCSRNPGL